ncbi:MAG: MFS transporter [Pseudomonadota bacterium]
MSQPAAASLLSERRLAFALLLGAVACLGMGQTVTFAILPPIGREMGLGEQQVGLIFSVSALMWVLSSAFWGRLSDRWGRKPVILIGTLGYIVSTTCLILSINAGLSGAVSLTVAYVLMVATRSIYGLIGPGIRVASQAYIVDRTTREDRTVAIAGMAAAFGLGNVIGPGLGAAASIFGLLAPLWMIVTLIVCVGVATLLFLPENSRPGTRSNDVRLPFLDPRIRGYILFGLAVSFVVATPLQTAAFFFIDTLGFNANDAAQFVGVGLSAAAMAALFSQLVIVQRLRPPPFVMMSAGAAILLLAQLMMALSTHFATMAFALMLNGLGAGMALPGYTAGASLAVSNDEQGAIAGISGAVTAGGFCLVPFINLTLYQWSPSAPYFFDVGLMALALVFAFAFRRRAMSSDQ